MNHTTPVLTESVPYSWDELKKGQLPLNRRTEPPMPASSSNFRFAPNKDAAQAKPAQQVRTATAAAAPAPTPAAERAQPQAAASAGVDDKLVNDMVEALVPLIMERLHAQVSIMVDMTMKQAAAKIRNDFNNALKPTVQAAVRQVVSEKLAK